MVSHFVSDVLFNLALCFAWIAQEVYYWGMRCEGEPLLPRVVSNGLYDLTDMFTQVSRHFILHHADVYGWEERIYVLIDSRRLLNIVGVRFSLLDWIDFDTFAFAFKGLDFLSPTLRQKLFGNDYNNHTTWNAWASEFVEFLQNPGYQLMSWFESWNTKLDGFFLNPDLWLQERIAGLVLDIDDIIEQVTESILDDLYARYPKLEGLFDNPLVWVWTQILNVSESLFASVSSQFQNVSEHILRHLFEGVW